MSNRCPHILDRLSSFIDDHLPAAERRDVEMHLQICADCRTRWQELVRLREMLRTSPVLTPPDSFYQGVRRRIAAEADSRPGFSWGIPLKAFATACVVMIVVIVTREARKEHPTSFVSPPMSEGEPVAREESVAQQKVDRSLSNEEKPSNGPMPIQPSLPERKSFLKQPESLSGVKEKSKDRVAYGRGDKGTADEFRQKTVSEPMTKSLSQSSNVLLQARDTGGAASQYSYQDTERVLAKNAKKVAMMNKLEGMAPTGSPAAATPISNTGVELSGAGGGINDARTTVITTRHDWETFWREHIANGLSARAVPAVDFDHFMVVAVFPGEKSVSANDIRITRRYSEQGTVVVEYRSQSTGAVVGALLSMTSTADYQIIPKTDLPITFKKLP